MFAQGSGTVLSGGEDIALAVPRLPPLDGGALALPQPLPPSVAARFRRLFDLQARGDIPAALRETARIDTETPLGDAMLGHLLADRFLGPFSRPSAEQLRGWLERWPTLPDARAIHALLVVRLPPGEDAPRLPVGIAYAPEPQATPVPEESEPAGSALSRNPELDRSVWDAVRAHGPEGVNRLLQRTRDLTPAYAAQLRGEAAQILFTLNRDSEALALAEGGVQECHPGGRGACAHAALAGYAGGLAAWRLQRFDLARSLFEAAWRSDVTTPSLAAAAAYWAARAHVRTGTPARAAQWLQRAAERQRTFYGLLARRVLGLPAGFRKVARGERETLGEADIEAVAATPQGLRAFALLQLGQPERAMAELRGLWPAANLSRPLARALMLVAEQAGLTDLELQFADLLAAADGRPRESLRFPVPALRPANGFRVDPALIYGIARTESNFDSALISSAGARGLLQIMPETASFIIGHHRGGRLGRLLHDPAINLDLGQRYMIYLAGETAVGGNLLRMLAAYNAGPGFFDKRGEGIRDLGDPLLFIEAIPLDETRAYVPRVLTYTWIYAAQMHLPAPSLDELATGQWPRYHPFTDPQTAATRLH